MTAPIDTGVQHSPYCAVNNPFAGPEGGGGACDCLADELDRLRAENERLHVQLAGCGVAAMQNTTDTIAHRAGPTDYGWSGSYADVCRAVDREIVLRAENERLKDDKPLKMALEALTATRHENERLRAAIKVVIDGVGFPYDDVTGVGTDDLAELRAALEGK